MKQYVVTLDGKERCITHNRDNAYSYAKRIGGQVIVERELGKLEIAV